MPADEIVRKNRVIKSMTGFGRGREGNFNVEVISEVRALNHRFLDVSIRLPRIYTGFEPHLRKIVAEYISRGKVDVSVQRYGTSGAVMDVTVDYDLAERYHRCLQELKSALGLAGDLTVAEMLTLKEIVSPQEREDQIEKELELAERSLREALDGLNDMRKTEGEAMWNDIRSRLSAIKELAERVAPLVDQVPAQARARLERRIQELTGGMELNEDRLMQEVALIAERADVTEELTRLQSHVDQFLAFGSEGSPLGRKLEFLLQELHRELNTLGSKSASTDIASHVVIMKAEVEKIREQTQNLE
ncbi:MAG: YicC family protein [Deltaproteobacteria bacterium]|nr:YicC family protein [Deltaproteobacteria bacterium]